MNNFNRSAIKKHNTKQILINNLLKLKLNKHSMASVNKNTNVIILNSVPKQNNDVNDTIKNSKNEEDIIHSNTIITVPQQYNNNNNNNINNNQIQSAQTTCVSSLASDNVHDFTGSINVILKEYLPDIEKESVSDQEFLIVIDDMTKTFGEKSAFVNMKSVFKNGWIVDPEIPGLNSAVLLKLLWKQLQQLNEPSLFKHFNETLDQISMTCVQGISHRLFSDYISLCDDK